MLKSLSILLKIAIEILKEEVLEAIEKGNRLRADV
jgi:hypothetical protein